MTYSEGAGSPGATTTDLLDVGEERESGLVAQRYIDHAVVDKGAHGGDDSGLLPASERARGDKGADILAREAARGPDAAGTVPEGLPLGREVAEARGDAEEDRVVVKERLGLDDGVVRLGGRVHRGEDFVREGLGDSGDGLAIDATMVSRCSYW